MKWLLVVICFLSIALTYVDRANLAVAAPQIEQALHIGPAQMGLVMSGFFWTYALMQLPFGWLVDRVGPRVTLPLAVGWWSLSTVATAAATTPLALIACRLSLGVGEAGAYPSCVKLVSDRFRPAQRAFALSLVDSGSRVGSAISIPVVALIVSLLGWKASFAITGALGLVWMAGWFAVRRLEGEHVEQIAPMPDSDDQQRVTWISLFRFRAIWGMMLGFFCLNFAAFFFITWFPSYLVMARGFSLARLGTLGMAPALLAIPAGWSGGLVSDGLVRRGWSINAARKICIGVGMLASAVIMLSPFTQSVWLTLLLFGTSYGGIAFAAASIWSLPADVAPTPRHVASISGIQNFASGLAGILTSTFTGVMVALTRGSFTIPLVVIGVLCLLGAFSYLVIIGKIAPLGAERHGQHRVLGELEGIT